MTVTERKLSDDFVDFEIDKKLSTRKGSDQSDKIPKEINYPEENHNSKSHNGKEYHKQRISKVVCKDSYISINSHSESSSDDRNISKFIKSYEVYFTINEYMRPKLLYDERNEI